MNDTTSLLGLRKHLTSAAQMIGLGRSSTNASILANAEAISSAECQAMRQALLFTQAEAAEWLSAPPVSERAWQYWEAGKRTVPADVATALRGASAHRKQLIASALATLEEAGPHQAIAVAVWYAKSEDWKWTLRGHGPSWKIHNSVVAHLACQGLVKVVAFDATAYAAWSSKLPPILAANEMVRHVRWATEKAANIAGD